MKLHWFLFTAFYAIITQNYLARTAEDPSTGPPELSDSENILLNDLYGQIIAVIKEITTHEHPLKNDDQPAVLNFINPHGDTLLDGYLKNLESTYDDTLVDGNLRMYNVKIKGYEDIEEGDISTVLGDLKIHIVVNVKQLVIYGEFSEETPTIGVHEKWPFIVILTNVRVEGVAYLMLDQYKNTRVTKIIPTILCEEMHISTKPKIAQHGEVLKLALARLEHRVTLSLAKIAMLEMSMNYPQRNPEKKASPEQTVIYEARKFVNQLYDPLKISSLKNGDDQWRMNQFNLHGFSNFELQQIAVVVMDTSTKILAQIDIKNLHGNFSLVLRNQLYIGTISIGKTEFIARILLPYDNSTKVPIIEVLAMEQTDCQCRVYNKATGARVNKNEFDGTDFEQLSCLRVHNEISTSSIQEAIQIIIFNGVDLKMLDSSLQRVIHEYLILEGF